MIREVRSVSCMVWTWPNNNKRYMISWAATVKLKRPKLSPEDTEPPQHLSRCQGLGLQQRLGQWEFCSVLRDLAFRMTVTRTMDAFHSDTYKKKHCGRAGLPS